MKNSIFTEHKNIIIKIVLATVLLITGMMIGHGAVSTLLLLAAYVIIAIETIVDAVKGIFKGDIFDEDTLMCIASLSAIALGEFAEAVAILLFFNIGELFEDVAIDRSRNKIKALMDIRPDYANLQTDSDAIKVDPKKINTGDIIIIYPGEKIPLDGIVKEGNSYIDTKAITGESQPTEATKGTKVFSGSINLSGNLTVEVEKPYGESTAAKILSLIENSDERRSGAEKFTDRFAKIYTPAVVLAAIAVALIPGIITGEFVLWARRAVTLLVVSCPCALVISIPLCFFCGLGAASHNGILIKGSGYLELLGKVKTAAFDKTGTLTKGKFEIAEIHGEQELLSTVAAAEKYSPHPIAQSILAAASEVPEAINHEHLAGLGVRCELDGETVIAGNEELMRQAGIIPEYASRTGTVVHCAKGSKYLGYIVINDTLKDNAKNAIAELKSLNIERTVMLSGDNKAICDDIAAEAGVDTVYAELLPADKATLMEKLRADGITVFAGDGINDAPVLIAADVGVAMGGVGSDAAIESADVVLLDDDIGKLAKAIKLSRRTMGIVKQNIILSLGIKILIVILGVLGIANIWLAVFGDVGVLILAILNSLRVLRIVK